MECLTDCRKKQLAVEKCNQLRKATVMCKNNFCQVPLLDLTWFYGKLYSDVGNFGNLFIYTSTLLQGMKDKNVKSAVFEPH